MYDGPCKETQHTINDWQDATFGFSTSIRTATRLNEEMAELLSAVSDPILHGKIPEEIADVLIFLYNLAGLIDINVHREVDKKMAINRKREWNHDGTGHAYHK